MAFAMVKNLETAGTPTGCVVKSTFTVDLTRTDINL